MAEYGLTDQGFLAKRYEDIVADLIRLVLM